MSYEINPITNQTAITILSHGTITFKHTQSFTIPKNICLIQYSTPSKTLLSNEIPFIINAYKRENIAIDSGNIPPKFKLYYGFNDGKILKTRVAPKKHEPGASTLDVDLEFERYGHIVKNEKMGIFKGLAWTAGPDLIQELDNVKTKLSEFLTKLSAALPENKVTTVHQLSCRVYLDKARNRTEVTSADVDELARELENVSISSVRTAASDSIIKRMHKGKLLIISENLDEVKATLANKPIIQSKSKSKSSSAMSIVYSENSNKAMGNSSESRKKMLPLKLPSFFSIGDETAIEIQKTI